MPVNFGPQRFPIIPQSPDDVRVTTLGGTVVVPSSGIQILPNGSISFSVPEPGRYYVKITRSNGASATYPITVLGSTSGTSPSGTVFDYIDEYIEGKVHAKFVDEVLDPLSALRTALDFLYYRSPGLGASMSDIAAASLEDRNRSNHTGQQPSSTISDFTEAVQDAVASFLSAGTNVSISYNDTANTVTINSTGGSGGSLDPEAALDTIGAALIGVGNISVSVNDAADTITISTTATVNSTDAALRDRGTHTGTQTASTISDFNSSVDTRITAQRGINGGLATLDSGGKLVSIQLPTHTHDDRYYTESEVDTLLAGKMNIVILDSETDPLPPGTPSNTVVFYRE